MQTIKIIIEKYEDGYVAYPLGGVKGVVVGESDTYEEALADVKSAINFYIETFGPDALDTELPILEAFVVQEEFDENIWRHRLQEMTDEQLQAMVPPSPAVAVLAEEELDEREWDRIVSHPAVQQHLEKLEEEVKEDIAAGRVREWKSGEKFEDLLADYQPQKRFDEAEWRRKLAEMTEEQLQVMVPTTPVLAALVEEELDEREWDRLVAQPGSQELLRKMSEEVKAAIAAGEVEDGGFYCGEEETNPEVQEMLC